MLVKIYTDGAARGNPDGPGGYGTVLEYVDPKGQLHVKEMSRGYVKTTNNRMELMAVIAGAGGAEPTLYRGDLFRFPVCGERVQSALGGRMDP